MEGLISKDTAARLAAHDAGQDVARYLTIGQLEVGTWGVVRATIEQIHPTRTFQRKRGGDGMVGRVTLADATGSIDLVLWDGEIEAVCGRLRPGADVLVRGATVKAGWKGGWELGLGAATIETATSSTAAPVLQGTLIHLGPSETVQGDGGVRIKAEATLQVGGDEVVVVAWDDAIRALQVVVGAAVEVPDAVPHPALDGFWIAGF